MQKEVKTASLLFILAVIGYLIRYGLNVFLAQHLTASIYGDFCVAIKVLNILVCVTLLGTNIGANRFLGKYLELDKTYTAVHYLAWNVKLIIVSFVIVFFIAIISFSLMAFFHVFGLHDINQYRLSVYMLWLAPIGAVAILLQSFLLNTHHAFYPTILNEVFSYIIQIIFFAVVVLFFYYHLSNIDIVVGILISFLIIIITAGIILNKKLKLMINIGFKHIRSTKVLHTKWLETCLSVISNNIIFQLVCALDLIIVQIFVKDEANVGHYAAALTIIALIWLIPSNLYQLIKPKISSLVINEHGKIELQRMLDQTNRVVMSIIVILSILIILFSSTLLSHFGPTYTQAKSALILLTLGTGFAASSRIASMILAYADYQDFVLRISITEFVLMIILVTPATYFFGITGTAAATAFVMLIKPCCSIYYVRKKLGIRSTLIV